jgi:hypothetical protein
MTAITVYKYGENPRPIQHFDLEEHIKYGWFTEPQQFPPDIAAEFNDFDSKLKSAESPLEPELITPKKKIKSTPVDPE